MINKADLVRGKYYWVLDKRTNEYKIANYQIGWLFYGEIAYMYPFDKFVPVKEIPEPES